jgi:hypothetical protein
VNLFIALATLLVLSAAAIAALVQLRHIRSSNESNTFSTALELWFTPSVQRGLGFIQHDLAAKMDDPAFRGELDAQGGVDHERHPELNVLDYFDNLGIYVVLGTVREGLILQAAAQLIATLWETLSPTIAIMRRKRGKQLYASFEYLAWRARLWNKRYPDGYTPSGFTRLPNPDVWRTADETAATTTAPHG